MIHKVTGYSASWAVKANDLTVTLIYNDKNGKPTQRYPLGFDSVAAFSAFITMLNKHKGRFLWDDSAKCLIIESEAG